MTAAGSRARSLRAVEFFIANLTKPDNIALVIMFFVTIATVWVCIREIIINDRFIKRGEKDKIYERMARF